MSKTLWRSAFTLICALQVGVLRADGDVSLQQGVQFSLYASSNCKRVDIPKIDIQLDCDFKGKQATFILKEFPDSPVPKIGDEALTGNIQVWARQVLSSAEPDMTLRVRLFGGSGEYGGASEPTIMNRYGFLYKSAEEAAKYSQDFEKRVLVRVHFSLGYGTAVLVVISDFDRATLFKASHGVPDEVLTMFASLDLVRRRRPPL